ncbi:helix-turn-helix domain-containing protein [Streptomyces sp. NPDC006649]|uniref:helix-turn-helix domain-containing protein n=1 Tax=Streptomyces sp. NPDC006649 TaxID=3156896 RepID=UPI0033ACD246
MSDSIPSDVQAETVMRVLRGEIRSRTAADALGISEPYVASWVRQYVRAGAQKLAGRVVCSSTSAHAAQAEQLRSALDEVNEELAVLKDVLYLAACREKTE